MKQIHIHITINLPDDAEPTVTAHISQPVALGVGDVEGRFLDEVCLTRRNARVAASVLYAAYVDWCERSSVHPKSVKTFVASLEQRGLFRKRNAQGQYWIGLALKP